MTPRKELYIAVKSALKSVSKLEMIALNRNQFAEDFPELWTAALIDIANIDWEMMTNNGAEGNTLLEVTLYCKDGFSDQFEGSKDDEDGFTEIDLLDDITETLSFLKGTQFKPLVLTKDEKVSQENAGIFAYKLSFETQLYRKINYHYTAKKVTINPQS